jgi:hypothetical protein
MKKNGALALRMSYPDGYKSEMMNIYSLPSFTLVALKASAFIYAFMLYL